MYRSRSTPIDRELLVALFRLVPPEKVLRYYSVTHSIVNECCGGNFFNHIHSTIEGNCLAWEESKEGRNSLLLYLREIHSVRSLSELEPILEDAFNKDRLRAEIDNHHLFPWLESLNGFLWPLLIGRNYLEFHNGYYWVSFEHGLRWRKLTLDIPQDILVCAFHAFNSINTGYTHQQLPELNWPVHLPIYHNLIWGTLDRAAYKGELSDNHLHYIAGPDTFYPAWISLMNQPENRSNDLKAAGLIDANLQAQTIFEPGIALISWEHKLTIAAAIRLFLYSYIKYNNKTSTANDDDVAGINKRLEDLEKLLKEICSHCSHQSEFVLPFQQTELKAFIDGLHIEEGVFRLNNNQFGGAVDYALRTDLFNTEPIIGEEILAVGERAFLVDIFKAIYRNETWIKPHKDLFLLYLQIATQFKAELVQSNGKIGFENFFDYQNRKEAILDSMPQFQSLRKGLWLQSRLLGNHKQILKLNYQNIRIAPGKGFSKRITIANRDLEISLRFGKKVADQQKVDIQYLQNGFHNTTTKEVLSKLGVAVHFIKKKDKPIKDISVNINQSYCRHYSLRNEVKKQALEIANWLTYCEDEDIKLWRGPDAASNELHCRIEVFAQAMRFLRNQKPIRYYHLEKVRQPKVYSHCGEEFLDILDGLRYIDECIRFQELKSGDPLGHALALGVEPTYFYKKKRNRLDLPAQVYLDNIVWVLGNIPKLNITISTALQAKLTQEFQRLVSEIYDCEALSPEVFYQAWKLRGDNPLIYENLNETNPKIASIGIYSPEEWDYYDIYKINEEDAYIRDRSDVKKIVNLYHFNVKVKEKGERVEHIKVDGEIIELITQFQRAMNKKVAKLGLVIEALPSVNLAISPIDKFEEHPIFKFAPLNTFNKSLMDYEQHISINTDNPGVCNLSIENELMLLYLSMQKQKDDDGNRKYNDNEILNWLQKRISQSHEQNYRAF